jgi:hypothetical protein
MTPSSCSTTHNTTASGISCPGARSLLAELTSDFEAEGKKSVRGCLRSKSLPCPQVAAILQRQDYFDQLVPANQILQQEYLPLLSQSSQHQSSMWYMSRVSTILRLIQLLLESKQQQQQQRPPLGDHNSSSNSPTHTSTLPPPQLDKLASMLLLKLAKAMVSCPVTAPQEDDDDDDDLLTSDASTSYNPHQVVSYCFASMLRLNHYAKTRVVLIPPLWKGLCDLSENCPSQLLEQALQALSVYLSEGQSQVIRYSQIYMETGNPPIAAQQQAGQTKLMGFLVARVSSLLSALAKTTDNLSESAAITSVLESFLRLRGIVSAVQVFLVEKQAFQQDEQNAFLQPYLEIGNKVEKVVAEWILVHGDESSNVVHRSALNSLLQLQLSSNSSSKNRLADLALSLGRAQLLQRILVDVTTQVTTEFQDEQDVESILSLCEFMILQVLPQCHAPFMSVSLTLNTPESAPSRIVSCLISQSLQLLSKSLFLVEASMQETTKRMQLYRLLVRWLAPQRADQCQHATSRELAISIVYWQILGSNQDAAPLISLLAKLFLDPRTGIHLRQNIGAVILQLLSSTTTKKQLVSTFLSHELVRLLASNSPTTKRKRSSRQPPLSWKLYALEDFQTIGNIFSHLSPTLMTPDLKTMVGTFCRQDPSSMRGQGLELKALLLYCLQGCLRNSDIGSKQFQQVTGGKTISQLLDMVVSWTAKLCQLETLQTCPSIWTKKRAILVISVLSFCTQSCALGQGRHQIQQLCRLLSLCTSSPFLPSPTNKNNSDQYLLPVMFQAITLLRTIGKVVPPDCPQTILQVSTRL